MKICNLASGSRGNCTLIVTPDTSIMIDDGLTMSQLDQRLSAMSQLDLKKLAGIIITHEHSDHTKGLVKLSNTYKIPVYMHRASVENFYEREELRYLVEQDMDKAFELGGLHIEPFRLPHDSAYNLGYRITDGKSRLAIATDLGYVSESTLGWLKGNDAVILESNHDLTMLKCGSYPAYLKKRIESKNGHLSNDDCSTALVELCRSGVKNVMLAHLSQDNNTPEIAFECSKNNLMREGIKEGDDVIIDVASQFHPSRIIEI